MRVLPSPGNTRESRPRLKRKGRRAVSTENPQTPKTGKTPRERAEEKHEEKLELVREQVENGSLVIRQMTDEERERYPPRPAEPKRPRRR